MASIPDRILKLVGESGFWRVVGRGHAWIYETSGGRLGADLGGVPHLLLTTTGRKSGAPRTVPLAYLRDGDAFVLVGSNGGSDRPPAWWLNLQKTPRARLRVGPEEFPVRAAEARGTERERLWRELVEFLPIYATYESLADRAIPVVVLRREDQARATTTAQS